MSSVAYRNQASGFTGNPLGLDASLRSYSAGAGRKVSGSEAWVDAGGLAEEERPVSDAAYGRGVNEA
ncbi:MAG: hypothetical protein ACE5LU_13455 [Anaerolineae bacterium]